MIWHPYLLTTFGTCNRLDHSKALALHKHVLSKLILPTEVVAVCLPPISKRGITFAFSGTNERHAGLAAEKETAGEGTKGRPAFGVSARTGGRFFIQPGGYGTKIANCGRTFLFRPDFCGGAHRLA